MSKRNMKRKLVSILVIIFLVIGGLTTSMILNFNFQPASAASTWTQTSDTDFEKGTSHNLSIIGTDENAELQINLSEFHDWTKKSTSLGLIVRHKMAPIWDKKKVLLFGGLDGGGFSDKTWIYDLNTNIWTNKNPLGAKPDGRYHVGLASVWGDDKVVMFGGADSTFPYYNDETWIYDLSDNKWEQKTHSTKPSARAYHAMGTIEGHNKIVIFGGYDGSIKYNDTWTYDVIKDEWLKQNPINYPRSRLSCEVTSISGTDKLILFGGSQTGPKDETWIYDYSEDSWTQKFQINKPAGRYAYAMATIFGTDNVLLFGGSSGGDETWVYDFKNNTWTEKKYQNPSDKPSDRYNHAMAGVFGTDKVVFFGGGTSSGNPVPDKTWIYEHNLPTKNGTYISKPFDTGSDSDFKTIRWYANTPENTSIEFQLRSAPDESGLIDEEFVGPNGSMTTYYNTSGEPIWSGHYGNRWVQYKAYLNISIFTDSPSLKDITISYNCLPKTTAVGPSHGSLFTHNKLFFSWLFEDHDSEHQKAFQVLIDDDFDFKFAMIDSGIQISADEVWEFPIGTNYTTIPDGTWYWKIRTMDEDAAWTNYTVPLMFKIDSHAPSSSPTIPINNKCYQRINTISGIATDHINGTGIQKVEIAINRLSDNNCWDGSSWVSLPVWLKASGTTEWTFNSSRVAWNSGTRYSVKSRAMDNATNIEQPNSGTLFNIDTDMPSSSILIPTNNIWVNELNSISGNSIDIGGSGVDKVEISIESTEDNNYWDGVGWNPDKAWLLTSGTELWSFDTTNVQFTTGTEYNINPRATDQAGNIEMLGLVTSFSYDARPPVNLSILINNDDEYTSNYNVMLYCDAEDVHSGISQMSFSTSGTNWTSWEPFNHETPFTLQTDDSEKILYFRVQDRAGNIAKSVFDRIILDSTPPTDLSIVINENANYTNSTTITSNLNAKDLHSGLSDMSFSYDGTSWTSWEVFNYEREITLPPNDGERIIYFRVRDRAGNIAEFVSDTIILDRTPPQFLSIMINNGTTETDSITVKLVLRASDNLSGIHSMAFSTDGEYWMAWEPYVIERLFTLLPNDGEKTIYFRIKDNAGNIAEPVHSTILLNTSSTKIVTPSSEEESFGPGLWYFLMIITIILILIIFGLILVLKRKKPIERQITLPGLPGAVAIKPGTLSAPAVVSEQVTPASALAQLPESAVASTGVTEPREPIPSATTVPKLAKVTVTASEAVKQQPKTPVQQLPQLPPRLSSTDPSATPPSQVQSVTQQPQKPQQLMQPQQTLESQQTQKPQKMNM